MINFHLLYMHHGREREREADLVKSEDDEADHEQ